MTADISVVIPTYDRAHMMRRALDSVLAQTLAADEIIVVDDGSGDATASIAQTYPQIRYIHQGHAGVSAARNRGIAAAGGEWIALLDSDDEWLPEKLERQCEALPEAARIAHCDEIWIRHGKRVNPGRKHAKTGGWMYRRCLPLCAISPSAVLIHRSVFAEVGCFDESLPACEDYDLWLRICARFPVHYLAERLVVKHAGHGDQLSRRYWGMDRFRIRALEKILASDARTLNAADYRATLNTLLEKLDIYIDGARKRDKRDEVARLEAKRRYYASANP